MKKEKKKPQINPESKAENTTIKEIEPKKKKRGRYVDKVKGYTGDQLKEYIEKIAKNEMGYVSEGERIFYNVSGE